MKELRQRLVRELSSRDSGIALRALEELKAYNWLYDGSISGAILPSANLEQADLSYSDLRGVMLSAAKLKGAGFEFADLSHANLWYADLDHATFEGAELHHTDLRNTNANDRQLVIARSLRCARMPNGRRHDGRYRLPGDLEAAKAQAIDVDNRYEMAGFYVVSETRYLDGQSWADNKLAKLLDSYDASQPTFR